MTLFVTLTRYAAGKPVRVNAVAIAYLDTIGDGANVAFGSGETLRVAETVGEVEARIAEAAAPKETPRVDPASAAASPRRARAA